MKRESSAYLEDILECIQRIKEDTFKFTFSEFQKKRTNRDAVLRNLEIIGEAVSQLPQDLKYQYPEVPWVEIKNFRNVVAHHYFMLNLERIWDIVQEKLDVLEKQVAEILTEIKRSKNDKYRN